MRYLRSGGLLFLIVACCVLRVSQSPVVADELLRTGPGQDVRAATSVNKPQMIAVEELAPLHPLLSVLKYARAEKNYLQRNVQSVRCRLTKRERINDELQDLHFIDMELQEEMLNSNAVVRPMRVFLSFLKPSTVNGRKVLFIEGANHGKMLVRVGGKRFSYAVVRIEPLGESAQRESLVPITELGFGRLLDRQIQVLESHIRIDPSGENSEVAHSQDAKINGRACECIRIVHARKQPGLTFHRAHVYVDKELHVPVRIDASDWPDQPNGPCPLLAEYTYTDVRLNIDFPDATFDESRLKQ